MSYPSWFNQTESIKKTANKKEDIVYKHLLSGALSAKADFSTKDTVIEQKSTDKKSIRVTEKICDKLIKEALTMGKENSMLILDLPKYYLVCKVTKKSEIE